MVPAEEFNILTRGQRDYIIEELVIIHGCIPSGLLFGRQISSLKLPIFIVYPRKEDKAFVEGKKMLEKYQNENGQSFLFDVQHFPIEISEDDNLTEIDQNKSHPHYKAKTDKDNLITKLLQSETKRVVFLISIGQDYHEGHHLQAMINLFKRAIESCVECIQDDEICKNYNNKPTHHYQSRLEKAKGNWDIQVLIADTLQSYNEQFLTQQDYDQIKKKYKDLGKEWKDRAEVEFKKLETAGANRLKVSIQYQFWENTLLLAIKQYQFKERFSYLLENYNNDSPFKTAIIIKGLSHKRRALKKETLTEEKKESVQRSVPYQIPGLIYQKVPGDGHCLFHAVGLHVNQDQAYLRRIVAAHLEHNKNDFSIFIQLPEGQTIENYIQAIREGKEWADHIEIEVLMRVLDRPIIVMGSDLIIRNREVLERGLRGEPIFVLYNGRDHYDAFLRDEGTSSQHIINFLTQSNEHSQKKQCIISKQHQISHIQDLLLQYKSKPKPADRQSIQQALPKPILATIRKHINYQNDLNIGTTVQNDSFFDALAQALNNIQMTKKYTSLLLREECAKSYATNQKSVIDKILDEEFNGNLPDNYDYAEKMNYIPGNYRVEGKILCDKLKLDSIHIIAVSSNSNSQQNISVTQIKITNKNITKYNKKNLTISRSVPTLIYNQTTDHYVPLLYVSKQQKSQLIGYSNIIKSEQTSYILKQKAIVRAVIFEFSHNFMDANFDYNTLQFNLPDYQSEFMILRTKLLNNIKMYFDNAHFGKSKIVACYGMSGTGKSHLARSYIQYTDIQYTFKIWVRAATITGDLIFFAQALNPLNAFNYINKNTKPNEILKNIKSWLEFEENKGWLLIIDDVTHFEEIKNHIPERGGHILLTTRNENCMLVTDIHKLEVSNMEDKEATKLLKQYYPKKGTDHSFSHLADKLGHLPIALTNAGNYLKQKFYKKKNTDYIKKYQDKFDEIIKTHDLTNGEISLNTVAATLHLSLKSIQKEDRAKHQLSLSEELLNICAYLSPYNIPYSILENWFNNKYPDKNNTEPGLLLRVIKQLESRFLIKYKIEMNTLTIHRIVQDIFRNRQNKIFYLSMDDKLGVQDNIFFNSALAEIINILITELPTDKKHVHQYVEANKLLPHLEAALKYLYSYNEMYNIQNRLITSIITNYQYLAILNYLAKANRNKGYYLKENSILEKTLTVAKKHYEEHDPSIAKILIKLAHNYNRLAKPHERQICLNEAKKIIYQHTRVNIFSLLIQPLFFQAMMCNPAERQVRINTLKSQIEPQIPKHFKDDYLKFEEELTQFIASIDEINIEITNEIKSNHITPENFKQYLEKEYKQSLEIYNKFSNAFKDKKDYIELTLKMLNVIIHRQTNIKTVNELFEQAVISDQKDKVLFWVKIRDLLCYLGSAYNLSSEIQIKKEVLELALQMNEKLFNNNHSTNLPILLSLCSVYFSSGDKIKLCTILEQSFPSILRQPTHRCLNDKKYLLSIIENLKSANWLNSSAKIHLLLGLIPFAEQICGPQGFETIDLLVYLGNLYYKLKQFHEAKITLNKVILIIESEYDEYIITNSEAKFTIGLVYGECGDHTKQHELIEQALKIKRYIYGSNNIKLAEDLMIAYESYMKASNYDAAKLVLYQAYLIYAENPDYGKNHLLTFGIQLQLTLCGPGNPFNIINITSIITKYPSMYKVSQQLAQPRSDNAPCSNVDNTHTYNMTSQQSAINTSSEAILQKLLMNVEDYIPHEQSLAENLQRQIEQPVVIKAESIQGNQQKVLELPIAPFTNVDKIDVGVSQVNLNKQSSSLLSNKNSSDNSLLYRSNDQIFKINPQTFFEVTRNGIDLKVDGIDDEPINSEQDRILQEVLDDNDFELNVPKGHHKP